MTKVRLEIGRFVRVRYNDRNTGGLMDGLLVENLGDRAYRVFFPGGLSLLTIDRSQVVSVGPRVSVPIFG